MERKDNIKRGRPAFIGIERKCTGCGETKPMDEFIKDKRKPSGRGSRCLSCSRKRGKKYWGENKNKLMIRRKDYRQKNEAYYRNRRISLLSDGYIANNIRQTINLSTLTIKQNPDLIENYRQQIKVKRLIKSKKNDKSTETS
jgi:hypothetical protein